MAVIKFLFYLLAYTLIRVGNFVEKFIELFIDNIKRITLSIHRHSKNILSYSRRLFHFRFPKISYPKFSLPHISFPRRQKKQAHIGVNSPRIFSRKRRFVVNFFFFFFGIFFSSIFIFLPILGYVFVSDLPSLNKLSVAYIPQTTKLYDRDGGLLYEFYAEENRTLVALSDIPAHLRQATIAIEDQNFYSHPGFDLRGIARAFVSNVTDGEFQGGSTITQQLIKSALLTPDPTITRKTKEVILALWAEQKYDKDEILELYFNYVPYGGTAWGVQAASEVYFGKDVSEVTLPEAAFLAGLPRAPSVYSPFINSENVWKKRQLTVLRAMVRDGYVTQEQAEEAYNQKLAFEAPQTSIKAPHFVMYVKDFLVKKYGLYAVERGGLQITTSLDLDLQQFVEAEVRKTVEENRYLGIGNAASVITDPRNGDILAMVGSRDFFDREHDGNVNITTSLRQPGSTIKLITYTAALENGYTEGSLVQDSPITIKISGKESYKPVNYDGRYHGMVPLRIALANSYNIPAVRIAQKLTPELILEYGQKMGISSWRNDMPYGLSITLGGNEVTMLDLATAYGVIANNGQKAELDPILEVRDSYGKVLKEKDVHPVQVVSEGAAFIVEDILSDNRARSGAFGANSPLYIPDKRVSVKTGTTDNKRDNWTVGFTDNYVVATWVGNNDNTPLSPTLASGITGAAPLWRDVMESLVKDEEEHEVVIPETIIEKRCFGYEAYFLSGTEDKSRCWIPRPSPTPATQ